MFRTHYSILFLLFFVIPFSFGQDRSSNIEIVTQEKIQGIITILAYSPDGKLIACGSEKENSVKVWDIQSGKIIGKLDGHENATTAMCFNHAGTALITAAKDKKVILWSLMNWEMIDSTSITSNINAFARHDQASKFYAGTENGQVQEWNVSNIKQPTNLYQHSTSVNGIDCKKGFLASGSVDGNLIIYDLKEGQKKQEKRLHVAGVFDVDILPDGKEVVTISNAGSVHFWNLSNLESRHDFNASTLPISAYDANLEQDLIVTVSGPRIIKVWSLEGKLLNEFKSKTGDAADKQPIKAIQISPDGSTLASSGMIQRFIGRKSEEKNIIRVWDLKRGGLFATLEGKVNPIHTFDFHPTENKLVTLGEGDLITFWDFNLAEKIGSMELQPRNREIPPVRNPLAEAIKTPKTIKKEDFEKGALLSRLFKGLRRRNSRSMRTVAKERGQNLGAGIIKRQFKEKSLMKFSSKGTYLITKLPKDDIRLYDCATEKPTYISPLFSYQVSINGLMTSPDEKYLMVLGSGDSAITVIDLASKRFKTKLPTFAPPENFRFVYEANSMAFSPDGRLFAVCFNTGKTFVYNTLTWQMVFENVLPENMGYVKSPFVNFTKDGKHMVVKSMTGIKKYDTNNFDVFVTEPLKINGYSAPMDHPENYAITIKDDLLYFEHLLTGEVYESIDVSPNEITHISINPEGLVGITTTTGQFKLLQPDNGKEKVLMVADGDNYIFKTADNYYKVSKEGRDLVTFRIGNSAYPFEQFDAIFNRPDLVLETLGCQDKDLIALYERAYQKRIKKLGLKSKTSISLDDIPTAKVLNSAAIPAIASEPKITLEMSFSDLESLALYHIWINNVPLFGKNGKKITGKSIKTSEEINLVHGLNKVQVACQNLNGYESLIQTFYITLEGEEPKRDLYLAAIGTSDYKDDRYDLTYPVKDAKDLSNLMISNPNKAYNDIHVKELYDKGVTKENIAELKSFLKQSGPNDVVIVFIAGHGILDANFDYYFGTHDIDFSNPSKNGLAYESLENILDGIAANKKILIMDTCHSGEVDKEDVFVSNDEEEENEEDIAFRSVGDNIKEDETKATPTRLASELFNDLRRGTGATVISSAGGAEFAMESDQWKNGLFTYCMLNGLKNGTADLNADGKIMLLELQEYVVDKVTALSHGRQEPNSRIQNIELDFQIW